MEGGRQSSPPSSSLSLISGAWASHGIPIGNAYQIRGRSPHPLPAECCRGQPSKGVGDNPTRQPYCHTVSAQECLFPQGGSAARFLFFFSVVGSASFALFAVRLFLGPLFGKNFWERTFVFGRRCWFVLLSGVLLRFLFYDLTVRSRKCLENSLNVKFFLGVRSLFFGFSSTSFLFVCLFSRDTDQVVTRHPHTHWFGLFLFSFLSRRVWFIALFGRASCLLAFSSRCHSGPRAFLGFSWYLRGCFCVSCSWFLFFPFCFVLRPQVSRKPE